MLSKHELEQEIELAKMMVADIDKVFKKYAKAALEAQQKRLEKIRLEKYKDCDNPNELQELYGWGELTEKEYREGLCFFEEKETRWAQLSLIEKHRKNLRDIRDRWKGTVSELQQELNELNGVEKQQLSYVEQLEKQEREQRYAAMR